MLTQISDFLGTLASSFGYFPDTSIKFGFGAIVFFIMVLTIMTSYLMLINKKSA